MKQKMVVSNIRMPEDEWIQVKLMATEKRISMNEYIRQALEKVGRWEMLGFSSRDKTKSEQKAKLSLSDLGRIGRSAKNRKNLELSNDDKIIYDT